MADYCDDVERLIDRQLTDWPMVARNYEAVAHVLTRKFHMGKSTVVLQHNPARLRSTSAKVDDVSIKARKCFLCSVNQPIEQAHIEWHEKYKIQVNPYPIFPRHLTIASLEHTRQAIGGRMGHMVQLAQDLPDYVIFYNGPKCGASAPDHAHFQAGNRDFLPFCNEIWLFEVVEQGQDYLLELCSDINCNVFLISAKNAECATDMFCRLQQVLPVCNGDYEPLQNILCWADGDWVRIAVFPRTKHRPACYGTGKGRFMVSPAAVDLGGVWALPVESDFNQICENDILAIHSELCMQSEAVHAIIENYKRI